ncbi:DnaB-like helicase N-terminal domain-containing protein, partial [Brevibacillus massiliensis]|uniref:DnaB-like helicase N-terminal domain-containing protein n=1 Tax=Brevibacillus massiliensis TaxID=1118054 RepID=UPI00035EDEB2
MKMTSIGVDIADIAAEQSVLGAIFLDQNALDRIMFLEPRDFFVDRHQKIFEVMKYLHDQNKPVDVVTVTDEYQKFNRVNDMGGVSYLIELGKSCPTAANIDHYAQIVRSRAIRRRGAAAGAKIMELSREDFESDEEYFAAVEQLVSELRPREVGKMSSFRENKERYFEHLTKKAEFVLTGFNQFDEWAKGLWRGWLYVLAGRP